MVGIGACARTEVGMDENMNEEFVMEPERALQTTPVGYSGEASRAAASFNHVQRPAIALRLQSWRLVRRVAQLVSFGSFMRSYKSIAAACLLLLLIGLAIALRLGRTPRVGPLSIGGAHVEKMSALGVTTNPQFVISTSPNPNGGPPPPNVTNVTVFRIANPSPMRMSATFSVETSNGTEWITTDSYPILSNKTFSIPAGGCEVAFEAPHAELPWRINVTYHVQPASWKDFVKELIPRRFSLTGPTVARSL